MANEAHGLNHIEDHPLELKELEVLIKKASMRQWQIKWDLEKRNTPLGIMKPLLEDWIWCRHGSRDVDVSLTRLRTEAVRLQKYMHKIGLAEDSICPHCTLNVDETVQHFLLECPSNANYREILKAALSRYGIVRATSEMLLGYSNEEMEVKKVITRVMGKFPKSPGRVDTL